MLYIVHAPYKTLEDEYKINCFEIACQINHVDTGFTIFIC